MILGDVPTKELLLELVRRGRLTPIRAKRILMPPPNPRVKMKRADEWIRDNKGAYDQMLQSALGLARRGVKFGSRLLSEEMRWGDDSHPIADNIVPYVMFRMMQRNPELKGKVTLRIKVPKE